MSVRNVSYDGSNAQIREFKPETMVDHPTILLNAKRGSGKSWVIRSLLVNYRNLPGGMIICPTDCYDPFYSKFFPNVFIHHKYDSQIMANVLQRQETIIDKCKEKMKQKKKIDPRIYIVMDDCLDSKGSWAKDGPINTIFYNGRHLYITYILAIQYALGVGPDLRMNFDYIFLFANKMAAEQRKLHIYYAGIFQTFDSFRDVFTQITGSDHGVMVVVARINGSGGSDKIEDNVFWYKAKPDAPKYVGNKQFNKFNKDNFNPDWRQARKKMDIANIIQNDKKQSIKIAKVGDEN